MRDQYYIKPGYRANEQALTFEGVEPGTYWTNGRIQAAGYYQYYVYAKCLSMMQRQGYKNLMDVGCGAPVKVKELLYPWYDDVELVDQPSVAQIATEILPGCRFTSADLEDIDLNLSRKFDLIVCADVVEHLINPDNCLEFIRHHLAPYGLAVISTPERDYVRGKSCDYSPKPEHVREWNSEEFEQYITSRGFEIVESLWLPQGRLRQFEFLISRLFSPFLRNYRWSSCQVVVCRSTQESSKN